RVGDHRGAEIEQQVDDLARSNQVAPGIALERLVDDGDESGLVHVRSFRWVGCFSVVVFDYPSCTASDPSLLPEFQRAVPEVTKRTRFTRRSDGFGAGFLERLLQGVPREGGALDPHRELHDALQRFEVAEANTFELGLQVAAVALTFEL